MSRTTASKRPSTSSASTASRSGSISTSHEYRPSPLDAILAEQGLHRYRLEPPSWRAPWDGNDAVPRGDGTGEGKGKGKAWPVFYPTRDGMEEDQMTESAVKSGYAAKLPISADTFSAHGHILDNLKAKGMLENLSRIVTAVQRKRESNLPAYGPSTFRLPSRITLTDSKRESWFSDLANPAVPLSKLSRSVPHGYKGEKGLDMLAARKVEIARAVWFVRAFGGVEIQSLAKSRPLPTAISQYTSEFTSVVCEFVRKQLLSLTLPEPDDPTPVTATHSRTRTTSAGLGASSSGLKLQSDLKDPEARLAWKEKFDYTLTLLSSLLSACLLSTPQFVRFLVSILDPSSTTLAQLSVALLLVEQYWNEVLEDESSTARLARTCLIRLEQVERISATCSSPLYATLETTLTSLIRSAFLALPDAFASLFPVPIFPSTSLASSPLPLLPTQITEKLETVLLEPTQKTIAAEDVDDDDPAVLAMIRADLSDLAQRREDASVTPRDAGSHDDAEARERAQLDLITRLDNFAFPQTIASLHAQVFLPSSATAQTPSLSAPANSPNPSLVSPSFQTPAAASSSDPPRARQRGKAPLLSLGDALPILFTWSTTPCRLPGSHRKYVVADLVRLELERERLAEEKERARQGVRTRSRVTNSKGPHGVAEAFINWVDERYEAEGESTSEAKLDAKRVGSRSDVRALAEELMRVGALGYGHYTQKMIARGETERGGAAERKESIHLWILNTSAVEDPSGGGRRTTRGRKDEVENAKTTEDLLSLVQAELAMVIPGWTGGGGRDASATDPVGLDTRALLAAVSDLVELGERLSITRDIVGSGLSHLLNSDTSQLKLSPEAFALLVNVFDRARDSTGLLQLLVILTQKSPSAALLVEIVDLVTTRIDVWTALGGLPELAHALASTLETSTGSLRRRLLACLRPLAVAGYIKGPQNETILNATHPRIITVPSISTAAFQPPASSPLVELQTLTIDSSPIAVSQLAATLHSRYGGSNNESWLSLVIDSSVQLLNQLSSIDPVVGLCKELDERLGEGLEPALIRWMRGKVPQHLVSILGGSQGLQLVALLSELVVEGVLSLPVLVNDGFLPIWRSILVLVLPDLAKHVAEVGSDSLRLEATFSHTLSVLTDALARAVSVPPPGPSHDHPFPSPLSPSALLVQQRKCVRLGCLFSSSSLATVTSLLALLVLQQEVLCAANLAEEAQAASALFLRIVSLQEFQSLVVKIPQCVRVGMLESEFVQSFPSFEIWKPKLLAGLLVALKDGGEATPANLVSTEDWDLFLSGLTMWRLAVSRVEVEACLERLDLDSTLSSDDKNEALHTLSNHFLERVCTGEGQTYLGEQVIKCYHGAASDELVSVAFDRLAISITTLSTQAEASPARESAATAARSTIRLLEILLQSSVASARTSSLRLVLEAIKQYLGNLGDVGPDSISLETISLLVNVIDLAIRCTDGPTDKAIAELYAACLTGCATLSVSCAGNRNETSTVSSLLLDTCSHLLLALPDLSPATRPPSVHAFVHLPPASHISQSPMANPCLPDATFDRLTALFGSYGPSSSVPNPWELLDHSESSVALSSLSSSLSSRAPPTLPSPGISGYRAALTNGGPIDLAAFRARVIETVPAVTALDALSTTSSSSTTSSARPASLASTGDPRGKQTNFDFETPCTGLSIHARDHRRTTSAARTLASKLDQAATNGGMTAAGGGNAVAGRKRNVTGEAAGSKASAPGSVGGGAAAGTGGSGVAGSATTTNSQPLTASTAAPTTRGTKRKVSTSATTSGAEVIVIDDEEDEVAPPAKAAKKGKTAAKAVTSKGRKKK